MNRKGLLLVFSGPSGVGKGTVLKEYLDKHPNTVFSVSATTRKPREGEIHGRHYFFLSREEFDLLVENGGLLEYAQFAGNFYGTPREAVERGTGRFAGEGEMSRCTARFCYAAFL